MDCSPAIVRPRKVRMPATAAVFTLLVLSASTGPAWSQGGDGQPDPHRSESIGAPDDADRAATSETTEHKPARAKPSRFGFGTYGRVGLGTGLRGGSPEGVQIVAHGARIVQAPYMELDTYYRTSTESGVDVRTVATIAFDDKLFHYSGIADAVPTLRNLFAEAQATEALSLWVGSRMYRGDQIYLLDFWPLDDLNTVGGGLRWAKNKIDVAFHAGANRLQDPFQYQEDTVPGPGIDEETIVYLDRQRMVTSLKGSYFLRNDPDGLGMKVKGNFEVHGITSGERLLPDNSVQELPADSGVSIGAEFAAWGYGRGNTHANLFVRYSTGLAAFDELATPTGFARDRTLTGATSFFLGFSQNYELARAAVQAAGYLRYFKDADPSEADTDDGWEYIINARPHYSVLKTVQVALDLSYQVRFPQGINPTLGYASDPAILQVAPMVIYSPFGNGSYMRPHFRLLYRIANLNEGARGQYPMDDPRFDRANTHFLGVQAEWWFNSTYR